MAHANAKTDMTSRIDPMQTVDMLTHDGEIAGEHFLG
jgi:hypothetical protein